MAAKRITPAENNQGEIVIYQSETGDTKIDVHFVDETVWLTQQQMWRNCSRLPERMW